MSAETAEASTSLRAVHGKFWGLTAASTAPTARFGTGGAVGVHVAPGRRRGQCAKRTAAEIDAARYERWTPAEYERLGIEPVRSASGVLLHPDLLTTLGRLPKAKAKPKARGSKAKAAA